MIQNSTELCLDEICEGAELRELGDLLLDSTVDIVDVVHARGDELVDDAVVSLVAGEGDLAAVCSHDCLLKQEISIDRTFLLNQFSFERRIN